MKRFKYSPLGRKLKAQSDIAKEQYQKLDDTYEFHKIIKKEKLTLENYSKSDLMYDSNYSFYKQYHCIKKFDNLSIESKQLFLFELINQ